jgi:hypothetical protein
MLVVAVVVAMAPILLARGEQAAGQMAAGQMLEPLILVVEAEGVLVLMVVLAAPALSS